MSDNAVLYRHTHEQLGLIEIRPLSLTTDIPTLHSWVTQPYAAFWGMGNNTEADTRAFYQQLTGASHSDAYIGTVDGSPAFLIETYDPAHEPVGDCYPVMPGDRGMHFLAAPATTPISGFTYHAMVSVMAFLFSRAGVTRIVVEPDCRNRKIHRLNQRVGFFHQRRITLGEKQAYLAFCTATQFAASQNENRDAFHATRTLHERPESVAAPLTPDSWSTANRHLVGKAIAEFSHERLLHPTRVDNGGASGRGIYRLQADSGAIEYRFHADILALDHWHIDPLSIERTVDGAAQPLDIAEFVLEFQQSLGLDTAMLPTYLEELAGTLYSATYKATQTRALSSEQLAEADFQTIEGAMTEGHPTFLANNGRIGFGAVDYRAYAPEAATPLPLLWIAAHRNRAHFAACDDIDYPQLLAEEVDATTRERLSRELEARGLDLDAYYLLPVHPWQWFNKLTTVFAADIARGDLVCLGYSDDVYLPQQSIRTFFNVSHSHKHYVKTALSILNMGFVRGLSAEYMRNTPAINAWVHDRVASDDYLRECGFRTLRELATIGYRNPSYDCDALRGSPQQKMLAALWRESPTTKIAGGQRLMTMAALLHIDNSGQALLPAIIRRSGLSTDEWLHRYFRCYFQPLLHCYYAYNMVFMPHGENVILVLDQHAPAGAFMKDIGEEVCLLNDDTALPPQVQRIAVNVPEEIELLSIFTDIFDCFFRYLSAILHTQSGYPQTRFWEQVARSAREYQAAHPELEERFQQRDLFVDTFALSCLNRLQLVNNRQMMNLSDPAEALQFAGTLDNPIAPYRTTRYEQDRSLASA